MALHVLTYNLTLAMNIMGTHAPSHNDMDAKPKRSATSYCGNVIAQDGS